ncbi:HDOD domain-containing protein [Chitinimonas sp.]|uniref:HDOD domain-containing protein n=1 Tax=Chitinimonas sp. TaxID=1934313 RepID=UPI0035B20EF2
MINHPLASIDAWLRYFAASSLPTLAYSQQQLDTLRQNEALANLQQLARVIKHDALLALKTLRYLQNHRSSHQLNDVTTIDRVILMVGVQPLLDDFANSPSIEAQSAEYPAGISLARSLLQRAHLAAICADAIAAQRHDVDGSEVMTAALLRDIAEILIACYAPKLTLRVRAMQQRDRSIRSQVAQRVVFGFPYLDLQLALIEQWRLPPILKMLMDEGHAEHPRVRTVSHAVAFARHWSNGADDAALPDDYANIADLVSIDPEEAVQLCAAAVSKAGKAASWFAGPATEPASGA